ncbi:hypothetical protein FSP39_022731 [Pinctada imbricata]|uniref:Dehydrogenase/reductase SDR family member 1 n=1 Tax=Pinctada imbricata TaxID=66713 RepID=A0AA89BXX2_PINIB|nr:hypothetical protein FSP39_022731 [Pinctada imbricata]
MSLSGVVCVVTGASRGIGKGVALQLGEAGAIVYITAKHLTGDDDDPTGASLTDVATEVRLRGGHCIPVQCDHAKDADVKTLFEQVTKEQKGQLDILVNNAFDGIMTMADNLGKPFWEQPIKLWDEIMDVGLRNNYICTVHAAKLMVQRKKGLIINISSSGGLRYALNVPYGVSKEACDRMATDCAKELSRFNVAMVSLWPGHVLTEILEWLMDHDRWNLKIQNVSKSKLNI